MVPEGSTPVARTVLLDVGEQLQREIGPEKPGDLLECPPDVPWSHRIWIGLNYPEPTRDESRHLTRVFLVGLAEFTRQIVFLGQHHQRIIEKKGADNNNENQQMIRSQA